MKENITTEARMYVRERIEKYEEYLSQDLSLNERATIEKLIEEFQLLSSFIGK